MNDFRYECHDWDTDGYPGEYIYGDDIYTDDYYMDEKWKQIPGYSDYYVSNMGRVWSSKFKRFIKEHNTNKHGHLSVCLCVDGKPSYKLIHRLVAESFIENPNNYPIVRHIYDQPDMNTYLDLTWGNQSQNMRDSVKNGNIHTKPIIAVNHITKEKICFESANEASRALNIPQGNILQILRKKNGRVKARGYGFEYVNKEGCYEYN